MGFPVINTRSDLDAIQGTPEYDQFIEFLRGSMTVNKDVAIYPEGYGSPEYTGSAISPIWESIEDLSTIERFGFTKDDFV